MLVCHIRNDCNPVPVELVHEVDSGIVGSTVGGKRSIKVGHLISGF